MFTFPSHSLREARVVTAFVPGPSLPISGYGNSASGTTFPGNQNEWPILNGRGERIRTSGLYVPNVALYQAKLHPECHRTHAICAAKPSDYGRPRRRTILAKNP
jgi:hypothetical protein